MFKIFTDTDKITTSKEPERADIGPALRHTDIISWLKYQSSLHPYESGTTLITFSPYECKVIAEKLNGPNRRRMKTYSEQIARLMEKNDWDLIPDPACFTPDLDQINAQHRFWGSHLANVPLRIFVHFNCPKETYKFLDQGRRRSSAQLARDIPSGDILSNAAEWIWRFRENGMRPFVGAEKKSNEEIDTYCRDMMALHLRASLTAGGRFGEVRLASKGLMTAMHWICAQKNRAQADVFFESVATQTDFAKGRDARRDLHNFLVAQKDAKRASNWSTAGNTILAWNAWRLDQKVRLDWTPTRPFPGVQ